MPFRQSAMTDEERVATLRDEVAAMAGAAPSDVQVVRSPYRICPLGAHVDHQAGEVTGMALEEALLFGFVPRMDSVVQVGSRNFDGTVEFALAQVPPRPLGGWGDYLRGAAQALRRGHELRRGLFGIVDGVQNVAGLSSSAAVGVAYLLALERANDIAASAHDNIELDRIIENEYIGLNNGPLDQSTILLSRRGRLMYLDCESGRSSLHRCGAREELRVVILHSGISQQLSGTDYNRRVSECEEATRLLLRAAGSPAGRAVRLRDVSQAVFEAFKDSLPTALRRRAEHFFGEQRRVREGVLLWQAGDLAAFGRLVSESGQSSIDNYECGNRYLRTAYHVLRDTPGVLGARFSGAGFRGCCIGIMAEPLSASTRESILSRYLEQHPDMRGCAEVRFCRTADGAGFL